MKGIFSPHPSNQIAGYPANPPGVEVVALEQHVCRLDVAVHQLHAVQVLDGQGHLKQCQVQRLQGRGGGESNVGVECEWASRKCDQVQ